MVVDAMSVSVCKAVFHEHACHLDDDVVSQLTRAQLSMLAMSRPGGDTMLGLFYSVVVLVCASHVSSGRFQGAGVRQA